MRTEGKPVTNLEIFSIDPVLKKPNIAMVVRPSFGKLTAPSRKLLNAIFYLTQIQITKLKKTWDGGLPDNVGLISFSCSKVELLDLITPPGASRDGRWGTLKANILSLQMTRLEFSAADMNIKKDSIQWDSFTLLAGASRYEENGIEKIRWSLPHQVIESLNNPKEFTYLYMREVSKLTTYCSIALYEICTKYKDNPSKVTCTQTPEWWISVLSGDSKIDSIKKFNEKFKVNLIDWRHFRRDILLEAIRTINRLTQLTIELTEDKVGGSVVGVSFNIQKNAASPESVVTGLKPSKKSIDEIKLINLAFSLGFSEYSTLNLIGEYGLDVLNLGLNKYKFLTSKTGLETINHPLRYLRAILNSIAVEKPANPLPSPVSSENDAKRTPVSILDKYKLIYSECSDVDRETYNKMIEVRLRAKNFFSLVMKTSLEKHNLGGICLSEFKNIIDSSGQLGNMGEPGQLASC